MQITARMQCISGKYFTHTLTEMNNTANTRCDCIVGSKCGARAELDFT